MSGRGRRGRCQGRRGRGQGKSCTARSARRSEQGNSERAGGSRVGARVGEGWFVSLEPGPQRVEGLPPLSLPIMAAHYPSVPARWSDRRERHPAWDLVSRCDFILVGSAVLLSLIGAVMVYSATRVELTAVGGDPKFYLKCQLVLLYTAVTRAKKSVVILGDRWGIDNCAAKRQVDRRNTFLSFLLPEAHA